MIPAFPQFKPLSSEDLSFIFSHLKLFSRSICELNLANLFLWQDFDHPQLTCINHNLCLLISPENESPYFLEPLTHHKLLETVKVCLNHTGRISRASENFVSLLPLETFKIEPLRSQFDYLYLREDLANLKGRKYDGKRNHIRRFRASHPNYTFKALSPNDENEALKLFEKWFHFKEGSKYYPKLAYIAQKNALEKAFAYFEKLKLFGGAIWTEKQLGGFLVGSTLNSQTADLHFLYGDPELPGIVPTLLSEASQKIFGAFKYLNLEQDLGIPGLRQSKLSYYPIKLEKKFEISAVLKSSLFK